MMVKKDKLRSIEIKNHRFRLLMICNAISRVLNALRSICITPQQPVGIKKRAEPRFRCHVTRSTGPFHKYKRHAIRQSIVAG